MNLYRLLGIKLLVAVTMLLAAGCADDISPSGGDQKDFSPSVLRENRMLQYFAGASPGMAILKYAQADLDDNGKPDLVVIYHSAAGENRMCVVRSFGADFIATNDVPAPVSDQMIQFRNIDEKPPLEFIVQGRKGAKVGYAIYRIEQGRLIDLFGEGMPDCC